MAGREVSAGKTQVRAECGTGRLRRDVSWVGGCFSRQGLFRSCPGRGREDRAEEGYLCMAPLASMASSGHPECPAPCKFRADFEELVKEE